MRFSAVNKDNDDQPGYIMLNGVYLHGTLESFFGFDLVNIREEDLKEFIDGETDGFEGVEVSVDGYPDKVLLYAWEPRDTVFHRGLLVDAGDVEAISYAKMRFDERSAGL